MEALVRTGPLSITINAGGMDSYTGGVLCPQNTGGCPMYCSAMLNTGGSVN